MQIGEAVLEGFSYKVQMFTDACKDEEFSQKWWFLGRGWYCKQFGVFTPLEFLGCLFQVSEDAAGHPFLLFYLKTRAKRNVMHLFGKAWQRYD